MNSENHEFVWSFHIWINSDSYLNSFSHKWIHMHMNSFIWIYVQINMYDCIHHNTWILIYDFISFVDEGWYWLTAFLNLCFCNGPKQNLNSTQIILGVLSKENLYNPLVRLQTQCRVQVWVQVQAPAGHLAFTPEGYSRRQSKVLTPKSRAELLVQRSGTSWAGAAGRTGEHKHRAFPSLWQSLWSVTGSWWNFSCPILEHFCPLFAQIAQMGSLFDRIWAPACGTRTTGSTPAGANASDTSSTSPYLVHETNPQGSLDPNLRIPSTSF